jgi:hypothetical protein
MLSRKMLLITVYIFLGLVVLALLILQLKTILVERDPQQQIFVTGHLPSPLPNGFYRGSSSIVPKVWIGKTFNLEKMIGINNFNGGIEHYPFTFYASQSLKDKQLQVIKIDYNQPQNPWWVRFIVDEVVATDTPSGYLGKINLRFAGLTFSVGYFTLTK